MAFELPSLGTSSELLWSQPTWFNSTLPVTRMLKRAGLSIAPRNNEGQEHRNFNRLGRPNRIQIASQGVKSTEGHWPRSGRKEMRVFVAGASGAVGKRLIPELVKAGHKVIGMTRSAEKRELVQSMGADHVAADALDRQAVLREIRRARPDVVVHENDGYTEGSESSQLRSGVRSNEQIANRRHRQSTGGCSSGRCSQIRGPELCRMAICARRGQIKTEEDPLDPDPPAAFRTSLAAIRHL